MWLAPVQAAVLPVTPDQNEYARRVKSTLAEAGLRVEADERNEKLGYKIREAQLAKAPYMLVVGKREVEQGGVAPRTRAGKDLGFLPAEKTVELLVEEAAWPKRPVIKEV